MFGLHLDRKRGLKALLGRLAAAGVSGAASAYFVLRIFAGLGKES